MISLTYSNYDEFLGYLNMPLLYQHTARIRRHHQLPYSALATANGSIWNCRLPPDITWAMHKHTDMPFIDIRAVLSIYAADDIFGTPARCARLLNYSSPNKDFSEARPSLQATMLNTHSGDLPTSPSHWPSRRRYFTKLPTMMSH
jgi:hypothetical protein